MSLFLNTADTLRAVADTDNVVAFTVTGDEVATGIDSFEILAQGLIQDAITTIYTAPASTQTLIKAIHLANTTAFNVTGVTFYVNGAAAANQLNGGITIPANGGALYDGEGWHVYDSSGIVQSVGGTGPAGTIAIGTVTTVPDTDPATVTNVGTPQAAILDFEIPQGEQGIQGLPGVVQSVVPGNNIDVDNTDPANPIVAVETLTLADISDVTASPTEVNYTDGVTSPIQTQLNDKLDDSMLDTDGTLSANSDAKIPSQKAVKTYSDQLIAAADALVFKGVIDASSNPNYPAADKGWTYRISVAGKIGGASGINVEIGDLLLCLVDGSPSGTQAAVGANWSIAQVNIDGAVVGPASASDNTPAVYDGASGKLIKNITYAAFKTNLVLVKADVGLPNVDNTSDVNKPISTAQQAALDLKVTGPAGTVTDDNPAVFDGTTGELIKQKTYAAFTALLSSATSLLKGLLSATDFNRIRKEWDAYADFGMIGDLKSAFEVPPGSQQIIASGAGVVTIPNAAATTPFTSADVGKRITIAGAGASGAMYVGTITGFNSSSSVNVSPNAGTTVTATPSGPYTCVQWGTDNTAAIAAMVSAINAQEYPCPKITWGHNGLAGWTNAWGFPTRPVFNKPVWWEGIGGGHTADTGDYTKIGGTRWAWWGTSSDGGTNFGSFIEVSPSGVQSIKRPRFSAGWIDCRNGDQNQALYGLKLASTHGAILDDGFFVMDALAAGLWTDIDSSPTEAKDNTRFNFHSLCFRNLDNSFGATTATTTTSTAVALSNGTPQTLTIASTTGYAAGGGYAIVNTTEGRRVLIKYAAVSGSTLTNCIVSAEDGLFTPTTYANAMIVPANPSAAAAMKLSGGTGANSCCGIVKAVQISFGENWGFPAIDCHNSDSIVFEQIMMNGGSDVTEANGNRKRRPGVQMNGSNTSLTLATRNNVFRDIDPGGSPIGARGGISVMGVLNTGALMLAPAAPNYVDLQQMGNGSPIPTVETGAYLDWTGNGMVSPGQVNNVSIATQALTAATLNKITGSEVRMPPQGWQLGTTFEWAIPLRKTTLVGTSIIVNIRQNATGTAGSGGTVIATATYTGTAVADEGEFRLKLVCTALGSGTSGACIGNFFLSHNLAATGLSTGVVAPAAQATGADGTVRSRPTMAGFDTTLPNAGPAFLFVEINPVTASTAITIDPPVVVQCLKSGNP